jgi:hypothetical protein
MAQRAEFEEKQFEGAANAELGRERGRVFSPGQVEENVLGYDAAAVPDEAVAELLHRIAGIRIDPPVWLTPNWWLRCPRQPEGSALPSRFASLLLQYKRPELCFSPADPLFDAHGTAYFRIALARSQHTTLVRLDEALNDEATVRYAAPCTISRRDLEQWQLDVNVLPNTNFVSPRRIGLRHNSWTYTQPGAYGFRNEYAEGDEPISSDDASSLFRLLVESRSDRTTLTQHISEMLAAIAGSDLNERVDQVVAAADDFLPEQEGSAALAVAVRIRLIGLALTESGTSWWLIELGD